MFSPYCIFMLIQTCCLCAPGGTAPIPIQRSGTAPPNLIERYAAWHKKNELRAFGSPDAANLAWWESYLLQSYLAMYDATEDTFWLSRLCAHADTMIAVMRDAPDSGDYWPGYRDGLLGWGTTRYDPNKRYQEYLVHDGQICLPLARFCRLVLNNDSLAARFGRRAERYRSVIENSIVAKWFASWRAERGESEHLAGFGGWERVPFNQSLVFGELLLVLGSIGGSSVPGPIPAWFYSAVADSMARLFRQSLTLRHEHDAFVWSHWPGAARTMRYEDISHANLDISFALEAGQRGSVFSAADYGRLARTLTRIMWDGSDGNPKFSRFVNGTGGYADYSALQSWLALGSYEYDAYRLVSRVYLVNPEWTDPASTSAHRALVLAGLAVFERRGRKPASIECGSPESQETDFSVTRCVVSPNPFRGHTIINFPSLRHPPGVIRIHDATGRSVRSLSVPHSPISITYSLTWDGADDRGQQVPSGPYYITGHGSAQGIILAMQR